MRLAGDIPACARCARWCSWGAEVRLNLVFELGGHKVKVLRFAGESPREVCNEEGELFEEYGESLFS